MEKDKKSSFWVKSILLSAIITGCILYLIFLFVMNYLTVGSVDEIGITYYIMALAHLCVILICILYLLEKIRYWKRTE
jgi:O-antigen/teichoic acid export membrane protein